MVLVTGVGSLPGSDVAGSLRAVFDQTPDLPYLPEWPARGPGAGMIGRTLGLLPGLPSSFDRGWRLSDHPGADLRRARTWLRDDLDRLEEVAADYAGPLKVSLCGPWTLAASTLLPRGGLILADPVARADLAAATVEAAVTLTAEVARRVPGASVIVQVDEPAVPAVLAGSVPTEGGYFRHRAVELTEVVTSLRPLAGPTAVLHCCASRVPIQALVGRGGAGFGGLSLDLDQLAELDALAEAVEGGTRLFLGCIAAGRVPSGDAVASDLLRRLRPLELGRTLTDNLVLTPSCGLADRTPAEVGRVFSALRAAAGIVGEELLG